MLGLRQAMVGERWGFRIPGDARLIEVGSWVRYFSWVSRVRQDILLSRRAGEMRFVRECESDLLCDARTVIHRHHSFVPVHGEPRRGSSAGGKSTKERVGFQSWVLRHGWQLAQDAHFGTSHRRGLERELRLHVLSMVHCLGDGKLFLLRRHHEIWNKRGSGRRQAGIQCLGGFIHHTGRER